MLLLASGVLGIDSTSINIYNGRDAHYWLVFIVRDTNKT